MVGYCSCAALAAQIAQRTGARLVLVDPDVVTADAVRRDFGALCAALGTDPPATHGPEAWDAAFRSARTRLAADQGGDAQAYEMVDDLLDRYRAFLRFLDASAAARPATVSGEVVIIAGRPLQRWQRLLTPPPRLRLHRVTPLRATLDSADVRALLRTALGG